MLTWRGACVCFDRPHLRDCTGRPALFLPRPARLSSAARRGASGAGTMQRTGGRGAPPDENAPPSGLPSAPRSAPRGLQARAPLRPASQSAQNVVATSIAWKELPPAATPAAPRARPASVSPDAVRPPRAARAPRPRAFATSQARAARARGAGPRAYLRQASLTLEPMHRSRARAQPLPRDHDRKHGGGGGSCHHCRHSSYLKLGEPGVLVSTMCRWWKNGKQHAFHRGCMLHDYPEQLVRPRAQAPPGRRAPRRAGRASERQLDPPKRMLRRAGRRGARTLTRAAARRRAGTAQPAPPSAAETAAR